MNNFRDKLKQGGYDAEEAYFYKVEQELIAKNREKNKKLELIQGGKQDEKPKAQNVAAKKAA